MSSTSSPSARLILEHAGSRRVVPLEPLPFTIGRSPERHLPLTHPQISREHCAIHRDADGYLLHDLNSRHGTLVNGMRVMTTRLRTGDRIVLGGARMASDSDAPTHLGDNELVFEDQPADATEDSSTRSLIARLAGAGSGVSAGTRGSQASDLETLSLFLQAAQSLNAFGAAQDVLHTMLEYTLRLTGAERGFVFLGDTAETLTLAASQPEIAAPGTVCPADISRSVLRDAADSQLDFIVSDISQQPAMTDGRASLVLNAIRSVVAIPLRTQHSARLLGLLYLDSHSTTRDFTRTGRATLEAIARQAATLLENLRMIEAEREAVLLRKELEIAATIQRQIIPETLPAIAGMRLTARTIPCTGVGGDFYDVIPTPDGFVALVGDVCGKGVPAALLAAMVQGMIHAQVTAQSAATTGATPALADLVQAVNDFVCLRAPTEKYVTLAILRYCHPAGDAPDAAAEIELINGGHVAPILVRADGHFESIEESDMPVGLLDFARFHAVSVRLAAGERLVLLSDGITEAEDATGTQFGNEALDSSLTEAATGTNPTAALFDAVDRFAHGVPAQDDRTVLTIERLA